LITTLSVPEGNPNLATSRLIHYCGYLRRDNLAAVEFDPDVRADAVIHDLGVVNMANDLSKYFPALDEVYKKPPRPGDYSDVYCDYVQ
jgi:hypothetical protein